MPPTVVALLVLPAEPCATSGWIAPTLIAHWSGQQWSEQSGVRTAPVVLALAALAFAVGVARHLADLGRPHPWMAAVAFTFIAGLGPALVLVRARQRPAAVAA